MAANTLIMYHNDEMSNLLPDSQDQNLWWSVDTHILFFNKECITFSFAFNYGHYLIHECLRPIATQSTQDTTQNIFDPPLTLIFRAG
jgi:hypothetical protein